MGKQRIVIRMAVEGRQATLKNLREGRDRGRDLPSRRRQRRRKTVEHRTPPTSKKPTEDSLVFLFSSRVFHSSASRPQSVYIKQTARLVFG